MDSHSIDTIGPELVRDHSFRYNPAPAFRGGVCICFLKPVGGASTNQETPHTFLSPALLAYYLVKPKLLICFSVVSIPSQALSQGVSEEPSISR